MPFTQLNKIVVPYHYLHQNWKRQISSLVRCRCSHRHTIVKLMPFQIYQTIHHIPAIISHSNSFFFPSLLKKRRWSPLWSQWYENKRARQKRLHTSFCTSRWLPFMLNTVIIFYSVSNKFSYFAATCSRLQFTIHNRHTVVQLTICTASSGTLLIQRKLWLELNINSKVTVISVAMLKGVAAFETENRNVLKGYYKHKYHLLPMYSTYKGHTFYML